MKEPIESVDQNIRDTLHAIADTIEVPKFQLGRNDRSVGARLRRRAAVFASGVGVLAASAVVILVFAALVTAPRTNDAAPETPKTTVPSASTGFHPPSSILDIGMAQPGSVMTYPVNVLATGMRIYRWLQSAAVTTVDVPKEPPTFAGDFGPPQLQFRDESGHQVSVEPACYWVQTLYKKNSLKYIDNTVLYKVRGQNIYLHSPELYQWLQKNQWLTEFQAGVAEPAQERAVSSVLQSGYGEDLRDKVPSVPGVVAKDIARGGPISDNGRLARVPVMSSTQATAEGSNTLVTFSEAWNEGKNRKTWSFVVSPNGRVLSRSESGDIPPQDWK